MECEATGSAGHSGVGQPAIDVPTLLRLQLVGYVMTRVTTGQSGADVYRCEAPGRQELFLKGASSTFAGEIEEEAGKLQWLTASGQPCAQVVATAREAGNFWLLANALPGRSLDQARDLGCSRLAKICAEALTELHHVAVVTCPFDLRFDVQLREAQRRVEAGLVHASEFDPQRAGQRPEELLAQLQSLRPAAEDLVVTHGDATFENLVESGGLFSGFVDCGRLGVADRHRDIALVTRSLEKVFGEEGSKEFFARYGQPIDRRMIELHRLMDEFF